jgi:beta-N-acetylhexosaminidase
MPSEPQRLYPFVLTRFLHEPVPTSDENALIGRMNTRAFITGIAGPELSAAEREFIDAQRPWGFILFKRNVENPSQVAKLVAEFRGVVGEPEAPVLIDQEGGRVQRLSPPHWPIYPAGAVFGALYDIDPGFGLSAARLSARLIAADLLDLGVTVDCLPLADVPAAGADAVIGNRAYGTDPKKVAAIARAVTEGLEQGGVLPVLKHIPGHGRATADTHFRLPEVNTSRAELERTDFAAFQPLADLPMAMTAHVVFSALDPAQPATTSATIIEQVIRGVIGFQGLLMSDDVSMNALAGSIAERTRAIVAAGCDVVLHCNGKLDEMRDVAAETPELSGKALQRAERALASRKPPQPFDRQAARAELDALMGRAGMKSA